MNDLLTQPNKEQKQESNHKLLFLVLAISLVISIVVVVILIVFIGKTGEFKAFVKTVNVPNGIHPDGAHYLPNGKIFLHYYTDVNQTEYHAAVMDDNGRNFHDVYHGTYKPIYRSNGVRDIPFADNKRILLGDYILECEEELQNCHDKAKLTKIIYPPEFTNSSTLWLVWSEPVVSQDMKKLVWTMLDTKLGSVNFIADLNKEEEGYKLINAKIISTLKFIDRDPSTGNVILPTVRGGEIKQFVNGGSALTLAGAGDHGLARSVYQNLASNNTYSITNKPNYDETTIMSPDEKLGITMSTRFSPHTNMAILGLMPVPHSFMVTSGMNIYAYTYAVTRVRSSIKGNIGPVLIDLKKSETDPSYMGINLHEDDDWNFASPISWHYSSTKAIFLEISKENSTKNQRRIRKVTLSHYLPLKKVPTTATPDQIPYAIDPSEYFKVNSSDFAGTVAGEKSGQITFNLNSTYKHAEYKEYSDDGKTTFDGQITFENKNGVGYYRFSVQAKGEHKGNGNFALTFDRNNNIVWDQTSGSVEWDNQSINVEIYKQ
ncbi:hypothetical protein TVAG_297440 [Trichomonas vaginalis G3]|uniref:Uncharacterized protein n=1 Tax=Trichomonas vaginalis (strain ATCC PRA-98 / G3) TaxID=412133 RepID=A2DRD9_TRIV3|nr:hypothetical protein TVAGG3_0513270 [Trichomonas vaginalis G3]EAY17065.1 hypothetical protein TVAG_297440 [Trichomonas vaginalis G3]KAI5517937.1 hypothetical protein TVAGG3_0513270 [Trichomonas vaginalis G3]|eukprot:XP_001329288.1 hypothetical protein [Trichomonas vaginalis G3]